VQGAKGDPCPSSDSACRGPKGDKGDTGDAGPAGPIGPAGPAGSGIASIVTLSGSIPVLAASGWSWSFVGPTAQVTLTAIQQITGSIVGMFGHSAAGTPTLNYAICAVPGNSSVQPAGPSSSQTLALYLTAFLPSDTAARVSYAVAASKSAGELSGADTYRVGLCTNQSAAINTNDYISGWLMIS
jgi:hypothetical protein